MEQTGRHHVNEHRPSIFLSRSATNILDHLDQKKMVAFNIVSKNCVEESIESRIGVMDPSSAHVNALVEATQDKDQNGLQQT